MADPSEVDMNSGVLLEALEDVHTRFLLNVPASELETFHRIFFQVEQAWWYYEDFIADVNPEVDLPRFKALKPFAKVMFQYSELLDEDKFHAMWNAFVVYKRGIANYGCLLLNMDCTKLVLCQVYNGNTFMLPAGKINEGEDGGDAAARETYEETGFDPLCNSGITSRWKESNPSLITWNPKMLDSHLILTEDRGKQRYCYVVIGVPEDFPFSPVARKEVASVQWHPIDDVPTPNFAVMPFVTSLKKWLRKNNRKQSKPRKRTPKKGRASRDNTPAKLKESPATVMLKSSATHAPIESSIGSQPTQISQNQERRTKQRKQVSALASQSDDVQFVQQWLARLPHPHTTNHFGTFQLDANEIWSKAVK